MKKLLFVWAIVWGISNLSGCGRSGGGQSGQPAPVVDAELTLIAFGAPWCTECKRDLPALDKLLKAEPDAIKSKVAAKVLVTSGAAHTAKPTDQIAQDYKKSLGISFTAEMDPWRCQTYRKVMEDPSCRLPAVALVDKSGKVVKKFAAGTFVPDDVIAVIQDTLH